MATTYDKASLVMIPSGYKDDKLFSIKPTDGSGDFTFSRDGAGASPATRVNASGLIEKGRENIVKYSNNFNTGWDQDRILSVTGGQTGYDGSTDAFLVVPDSVNNNHNIRRSDSTLTGVQTNSVYAKYSGYHLQLRATGIGATTAWVNFDLQNGTIERTGGGQIDANIESVGNGFYRCSITYNPPSASYIGIIMIQDPVNDSSLPSFVGDLTSGIIIQDAQAESGLVATSVIETTTAPVSAGLLGDMPRLDYSGGATCPSLLLEPSRVNVVEYAEYFDIYTKSNATITNNSDQSPEGLQNASSLVGNGATSSHYIFRNSGTAVSGTDYTISFFAKSGALDYVQLVMGSGAFGVMHQNFDLSNGTIGSSSGSVTPFIESYANNWYRVGVTITATASTTITPFIALANSSTMSRLASFATSDDVKIYGLQVESGSYPTSYIPTYGSASTRAVDAAVNSLGTSYFPTAGFSVFLEGDTTYDSITNFADLYQIAGTSAQLRLETRTGGRIYIQQGNMVTSGDNFNAYNLCPSTAKKICLTFSPTQMNAYVDGVLVNSFNGAYTWDITDLNMAMQTSSIAYKQTLVFPSVLTSSEAIALTTI